MKLYFVFFIRGKVGGGGGRADVEVAI